MHLLGGDFHLGDPSIVRYRKQFPTLGYHDEFICDTVLAPLRKHDLLTMVGDCLVKENMPTIQSMNGLLFLLLLWPH